MCILFDLDGTLVDTAPDFVQAVNQIRAEEGLTLLAAPIIRATVSQGIQGMVTVGFGLVKGEPRNEDIRHRVLKAYTNCSGRYATLFPGMLSLLDYLDETHIPWGIVTNKHSALSEPLIETLKLKARAACLVSGDTVAHPKPHPEPLLYACRQIGIAPEQCVYIGDAERDIQAGNRAGMTTIAVLFGYIEDENEVREWGANHYIHHADEIKPWYEAWKKTQRSR
jgi:2-phosphoglycolate phosphatase